MLQIINDNYDEVTKKAGEALSSLLSETSTPLLLLLSAGSAFKILDYVNLPSRNITVGMLDERFSQDDKVNNFLQLEKTQFYKKALDLQYIFMDSVPTHEDTKESLAERMNQNLNNWMNNNPNGRIAIVLGMGKDGHTAGIMPFPEDANNFHELFNKEYSYVTAYDAKNKNEYPLRITCNIPFLILKVDYTIAYTCGEEKLHILKEALKEGPLNEVPFRIIHQMKDVKLFTDINI